MQASMIAAAAIRLSLQAPATSATTRRRRAARVVHGVRLARWRYVTLGGERFLA